MNFLGMGPLELVLILGVALVFLGPERLPDLARQLGRAVGEIRKISSEVTGEIHRNMNGDPPRPTPPTYQPPPPPAQVPPPADPPATTFQAGPRSEDVRPPY